MRGPSVLMLSVLLVMVCSSGCLSDDDNKGPVKVRDAYCDDAGHFNFTLENMLDKRMAVGYNWTLNDPMADIPVIRGEGNVTLDANEKRPIVITIEYPERVNASDDDRFFVMHVKVLQDGKTINTYGEQKSPYDWDYSTLPPRRIPGK